MQSGSVSSLEASYVEQYLECVDNTAASLQPHISRLRNNDVRLMGMMGGLDSLLEEMERGDAGLHNTLDAIKLLLAHAQLNGDTKLAEVAAMEELLSNRCRRLDQHLQNFEPPVSTGSKNQMHRYSGMQKYRPQSGSPFASNSPTTGAHAGEMHLSSVSMANLAHGDEGMPNTSTFGGIRHSTSASALSTHEGVYRKPFSDRGRFSPEFRSSSATNRRGAQKRPRRPKQFIDRPPRYSESAADATSSTKKDPKLKATASRTAANGGSGGQSAKGDAGKVSDNSAPSVGAEDRQPTSSAVVAPTKERKKTVKRQRRNNFDIPPDPDEPVYCFCKQVSYGDMVGCDNDECTIEWFHFRCVQLTSSPKGKWYCPDCRGDKSTNMKK